MPNQIRISQRVWAKGLSEAFSSLVENDSDAARRAELTGNINPGHIPLAVLLDKQRRTAVTVGSCAVMLHQRATARIGRASDDPTLKVSG